MTRSELYADGDHPLTAADEQSFGELVARRARREPLAYVLGEWGFRRLTLRVDSRVLIPRPETESVVERCLELLDGLPEPRVLDVGVGSGAIALAIADEHPRRAVVATDSSAGALAVADENRRRTALTERVELVAGRALRRPARARSTSSSRTRRTLLRTRSTRLTRRSPATSRARRSWPAAPPRRSPSRRDRGSSPAARSCSRPRDGKAGAVAGLLTGLGYEEVSIGHDLAGRERVVDGRTPR